MSVIVAKRKQSMIEYVDTARKLAEIIPDRMENLLIFNIIFSSYPLRG